MKKIINTVSDIVISLMLTVTGVLFAVSCYSIYASGESQPFTYESIGAAFDKISIAVYITLALVVLGIVLSIIWPREEAKLRAPRRARSICERLAEKVDIESLQNEQKVKIMRERRLRRVLFYVNIAFIVLSATLPLIYLLNPATFPAVDGEYNSEVIHAFLFYLCMLVPIAAYELAYALACGASYSRESELLRGAIKDGAALDKADKTMKNAETKAPKLAARIICACVAVVFVVLGIINGGMGDVLAKAVAICAECIGLG